jgi:hypothetical protein
MKGCLEYFGKEVLLSNNLAYKSLKEFCEVYNYLFLGSALEVLESETQSFIII